MSIHLLIEQGKDADFKKLIDSFPNAIHDQTEAGRTPLHTAALFNRYNMAKILIKKGANLQSMDYEGWTPLHAAAAKGNYKLLELFLTRKGGVRVNATTTFGETPFAFLARVEEILDTQGLINSLRLLASCGGDASIPDDDLFTPLHYACDTGSIETVKFLLEEAKMNPNVANKVGNTPLHLAVQKGRLDVVDLLLSNGDFACKRNNNGLNASDFADKLNFESLGALIRQRIKQQEISTTCQEISECPFPIRFHFTASIYDKKIYIIGGCNSPTIEKATVFYTTMLEFCLVNEEWQEIKIEGEGELTLAGHCTSLLKNQLFISGGIKKNQKKNNNLILLQLYDFSYQILQPLSNIPHRFHQSIITSRSNIIFLGRQSKSTSLFDQIHLFDTINFIWLNFPIQDGCEAPVYREKYSACRIRNKIYLFAGIYEEKVFDDLWVYDINSNIWKLIHPIGFSPTPRYFHSSAQCGNNLIIFGGLNKKGEILSDGYNYDTVLNKWKSYNYEYPPEIPLNRIGSCNLIQIDKSKIYLFGGNPNCNKIADIFSLSKTLQLENIERIDDDSLSPNLNSPTSPHPPFSSPLALSIPSSRSLHELSNTYSGSPFDKKRDKTKKVKRKNTSLDHNNEIKEFESYAIELERYSNSISSKILEIVEIIDPLVSGEKILHASVQRDGEDPRTILKQMSKNLFDLINTKPEQKQFGNLKELLADTPKRGSGEKEKHTFLSSTFGGSANPVFGKGSGGSIEIERLPSGGEPNGTNGGGSAISFGNVKSQTPEIVRSGNVNVHNSVAGVQRRETKKGLYTSNSMKINDSHKYLMYGNFPLHYYEKLKLPPAFEQLKLPDDFQEQSKDLQSRFYIVSEILSTEIEYVRDLGVLVGLYMKPLQNEYSNLLQKYDCNSIFKNVEAILDLHLILLNLIETEYKKPQDQQDFGGCFLGLMEDFRRYLIFCANQVSSIETVDRILKQNQEFAQFCDYVKYRKESRLLTIDSFLIKPFQRICRYPLLLSELQKNTPENWKSYNTITQAIVAIDIVVRAANDSIRQTDSLVKVVQIQNQFVVQPGENDLNQLFRFQFIHQGILKATINKKKITVHLFLFNAILLIARPTKGKKLKKLYFLVTKNLVMPQSTDKLMSLLEDKKKAPKQSFTIIDTTSNLSLEFFASSVTERDFWVNAIENCSNNKK